MIECARFCPDCPLTPPGVEVEVSSVRLQTDYEAKMFGDQEVPSVATIRSVAVGVDPEAETRIEVGDEAQLVVEADGRKSDEIRQAIRDCDGPRRPFKIGKRVCSAVLLGAAS
jgi:hypothetical protein